MKLSMSSIHRLARSTRPHAADDRRFDPSKDISFSWWGIKLFVDLQIDPKGLEHVENTGQPSVADHVIQKNKDPEDDAIEEPDSTREASSLQCDTNAIRDPLFVNHQNEERDCDNQPPSDGAGAEPDTSWTHCTWPDWGEPLPPEDSDDDIDLDYAADGEENPTSQKLVTFSDVVTFVEPSCLQEERETGSFSYVGSSDDELEQGTDQVTSTSDGNSNDISHLRVSSSAEKESLNSADVSVACHLLELGNESNCGDSEAIDFESSGVSGKGTYEFYDPRRDLERLSELVEKIYAAVPQLCIVSSQSVPSEGVGTWTIEVSKNSGRLRMKRVKREKEAEVEGLGVLDVDDDNEVLERPPWKRQYKSLCKLS